MASFNNIKIEKIETAPSGENVQVIPDAGGGWAIARKVEGLWWDRRTDAQIVPEFWVSGLPTFQEIKDAFS